MSEPQKIPNKASDSPNENLSVNTTTESSKPPLPKKPPKPEDKPFEDFINQEFIPTFSKSLSARGVQIDLIQLEQGERPVVGGKCWMINGEIDQGRRFWLCFNEKQITSLKTIVLAERGSDPSLLESFLIDEKKTTLALLTSRLLQRLNGQKWLEAN